MSIEDFLLLILDSWIVSKMLDGIRYIFVSRHFTVNFDFNLHLMRILIFMNYES